MPFENNFVVARTIEDAWRDSMWLCVRNGYNYKIEQGSYVGQIRKQLPYVTIRITEPWTTPLAVRMPEGCGIPPVTSEENIYEYFYRFIIDKEKDTNEYTYGNYIVPQLPEVIEKLNDSNGNTNQACIQIGSMSSVIAENPPCLRIIDFKVAYGKLNMSLFFRSWDNYAGMPQNLGGLELLKQYVHSWLKFPVENGEIVAYSSGLHLYEMYFPLVNQLNVDKISI